MKKWVFAYHRLHSSFSLFLTNSFEILMFMPVITSPAGPTTFSQAEKNKQALKGHFFEKQIRQAGFCFIKKQRKPDEGH